LEVFNGYNIVTGAASGDGTDQLSDNDVYKSIFVSVDIYLYIYKWLYIYTYTYTYRYTSTYIKNGNVLILGGNV
jgi:hypothetical protein